MFFTSVVALLLGGVFLAVSFVKLGNGRYQRIILAGHIFSALLFWSGFFGIAFWWP